MIYNMLIYKNGDLLKSDCTVIMHQANCFSVMGAGIAKAIADKYEEAYLADKGLELTPEDRLGKYSIAYENGITIVNLYGQFNFGAGLKTNYEMLENAIDKFFTDYKEDNKVNLSKIGVPYKLGCGLAGGDWNIVKSILERQSCKHSLDIYIYKT